MGFCSRMFRVVGISSRLDSPDVPEWVEKLPRSGLRTLKEMATARVIVTNAGMKSWLKTSEMLSAAAARERSPR